MGPRAALAMSGFPLDHGAVGGTIILPGFRPSNGLNPVLEGRYHVEGKRRKVAESAERRNQVSSGVPKASWKICVLWDERERDGERRLLACKVRQAVPD